jgi:hypothetical protein
VAYRTLASIVVASSLLFPNFAEAERRLLFSGTVAELEPKRITVQRSASDNLPEEKKTFVITDATKVEGELRLSARVTIGFISSGQGDIATRIIVRPLTPKKN